VSAASPNAPSRREHPEPTEADARIPRWFIAFAAVMVLGGGAWLYTQVPTETAGYAGDSRTVQPASEVVGPEQLYALNCQGCHQANGLGVANVFPPLGGSEWVNRDPETPVRILLRGIQGEIVVAGNTYNGNMPSFSHLQDEEIAMLATHIRTSYGNEASPVDAAFVTELRAELADRPGPWAGGEELAALREE